MTHLAYKINDISFIIDFFTVQSDNIKNKHYALILFVTYVQFKCSLQKNSIVQLILSKNF